MSGSELSAFLDGVRVMVRQSDGYVAGLDDVIERGRALLASPSIDSIAAARAELDSAIRILQRRDLNVDLLSELGEELGASLLAEVAAEARRDGREYSRSVGERMLDELMREPSSPSELAEQLDVEISQISRAARMLREDGRLRVERAPGDGRRRIYRAAGVSVAAGSSWGWRTFVERLPALRVDDISSDLLPGRVGDDLSRAGMASVCAAFREDLETGRYEPTPVHEVEVPKPSGGVRPAAALRFADRLAYAALVERCRPEIEASLFADSTVLWPRGFKSDKQWVAMEGLVRESSQPYVLSVDIQSFYDSIRHDVLADALGRAGCDQVVVSALQHWLGEVTGGRRQGLPQGLVASDPLATAVLTPLDRALTAAGVCYMRHGDDLRILGSYEAVRDAERQVRQVLRSLELNINDDKTRVLRRDTYILHRTKISLAVREYLEASGSVERNSAIFTLLDALGADEELSWNWYHGTLSVGDVLSSLGSSLGPDETQALMLVLQAVAEAEEAATRCRARYRDQPMTFLMMAGMSLLAAAGAAGTANELRAPIVARPEYADVLSTYIEATAPVNPTAVAGLLQRIEASGVTYDAQWLRLYAALGDAGRTGAFDELAQTHLASAGQSWIRRLRAARFMAYRGRLDDAFLPHISEQAPPALRDDVLDIEWHTAPRPAHELARKEGATAAALVAAAS